LEDVANAQTPPVPPEDVPLLAESADPLTERHGGRQDLSGRMELRHDGHVVTLDVLAIAPPTLDLERPVREADPGPGNADDQEQTGRDRVERLGAEGPGGDVDREAEREDHPTASGKHQWLCRSRCRVPGSRAPSDARTQGALGLDCPDATEDAAPRRVIAGQAPASGAGRVTKRVRGSCRAFPGRSVRR